MWTFMSCIIIIKARFENVIQMFCHGVTYKYRTKWMSIDKTKVTWHSDTKMPNSQSYLISYFDLKLFTINSSNNTNIIKDIGRYHIKKEPKYTYDNYWTFVQNSNVANGISDFNSLFHVRSHIFSKQVPLLFTRIRSISPRDGFCSYLMTLLINKWPYLLWPLCLTVRRSNCFQWHQRSKVKVKFTVTFSS